MATWEIADARALLNWYAAMGVDESIGDEPINSFAPPTPEFGKAKPAPRQAAPKCTVAEAISFDRGSIAEAVTLAALETLVSQFDGCATEAHG